MASIADPQDESRLGPLPWVGTVIIVNGFNKFHLTSTARVLCQVGRLEVLITGAYPFACIRRWISWWTFGPGKLKKFSDRYDEVDEDRIYSNFSAEAVYFSNFLIRKLPGSLAAADWVDRSSYRYFAWRSQAAVSRASAATKIFHYRSGFGLHSARLAKRRGMKLICDHSIAHPQVLPCLVENRGQMPVRGKLPKAAPFWQGVIEDLSLADFVLVNSAFVKDTFVLAGFDPHTIAVIQWGVDEAFFRHVSMREPRVRTAGPVRFLFAGLFEKRKGAEILIDAFRTLRSTNWTFEVAGGVAPGIREQAEEFFRLPNVTWHGTMRRQQLAQLMSQCDVFVFPSLVEGSARVIFEAMACGAAIITTANSGSVVTDGINGWIVPVGEVDELNRAIEEAIRSLEKTTAIGTTNAETVRDQYRESNYAEQIFQLYSKATKEAPPV